MPAETHQAISAIRRRWSAVPRAGLILGSGLTDLAAQISVEAEFDFTELPGCGAASATGHRGKLVCGKLAGIDLAATCGRLHLYEGHSAAQVAFPVRLFQSLGAKTLMVTNAAGGLRGEFRCGDVVIIDDHVNLMFRNPLIGANDDAQEPRFADMAAPYDHALGDQAMSIARKLGFPAHRGVYVGMLGPNYETRAEYRMARRLGGDVVGMSTVPEVIAAAAARLRVLGISVVTNICLPDALGETTGEAVVSTAASASDHVHQLISGVLQSL